MRPSFVLAVIVAAIAAGFVGCGGVTAVGDCSVGGTSCDGSRIVTCTVSCPRDGSGILPGTCTGTLSEHDCNDDPGLAKTCVDVGQNGVACVDDPVSACSDAPRCDGDDVLVVCVNFSDEGVQYAVSEQCPGGCFQRDTGAECRP